MTWNTEEPFKQQGEPDPLGEGLSNIFRNLGGMSPGTLLASLMIQRLRQIHRELGDLISKLEVPGYKGPNPWAILGVSKAATHEEVKKAWKAKSFAAHPDRGGSNEQQKLVNLAYELICQLKGWKK